MSDESASSIPQEQLLEVVSYIDKMKDFDISNFIKLQEINDLVWGLLFLIAGITDFLFHQTDQSQLSAISWLLMSAGGMSLSLYINTRRSKEILTEEVVNISLRVKRAYRYVLMFTVFSWVFLTAIVSIFELEFLILPMVSFLIGSSILLMNYPNLDRNKARHFYKLSNRLYNLPFICYLATTINIIGYIINPEHVSFMGIIMGTLLAFGFGLGGFGGRR